jgi:heptosyltransferase-2
VIRFSSIGDIVLTTPVVRHLKQQVEDVEVHYLTKAGFRSVLENNPYIDRLWLFKDDLKTLIQSLKSESFDLIIDLHQNLRTRRIKMALRVPSESFNKLNFEKWAHVNFKWNSLPDIHVVDRYMDTISALVSDNDMQGLDYFTALEDDQVLERLPESIVQQGYLAMVIGGMHFTKQIPDVRIIEIIQNTKLPIVLLGGPDDTQKAQYIMNSVQSDQLINMVGACSLNQSAVLVRESKAVITSDTGLMHIASAYKKHIFSVWGNTIPEYGMYPYLPNAEDKQHIYEVKGLKCRSCSKIGHRKCPKHHFDCMELIDYPKLTSEINEITE